LGGSLRRHGEICWKIGSKVNARGVGISWHPFSGVIILGPVANSTIAIGSSDGSRDDGKLFPPTRWSLVVSLSDDAEPALEELCAIYWRPIYGFLRRTGYRREDAEDLTQSFFARLLRDRSFLSVNPEKGKLRSYLLSALKRHLVDHLRYQNRAKRGGGAIHLPMAISESDFEDAEHRYASHPVEEKTPDRIFDQGWALDLLTRVHRRIEEDYRAAGKSKEYLALREGLATAKEIEVKGAAAKLGVAPGTVHVLLHRLRQNFRAALRDEIADTVGSRNEIEDELSHLMTVFS